MTKKKHGRRKKTRTQRPGADDNDPSKRAPKSVVIKVGKIGSTVKELKSDLRNVMEPNTAAKLKEKKSNVLKDFLHVAGQLGVSHFLILSATDFGTYLRIAKVPRGPTLTFKIHSYALASDISRLQQKPHSPGVEYLHSPLLVLNNFPTDDENAKLTAVMLQNLFPALNVRKMKLSECRRVLLFSYIKETKRIEMRHYFIKVAPVGVSKSVKRLVRSQLPELHDFKDISDYVLGNTAPSDSEAEDAPEARVTLDREVIGGQLPRKLRGIKTEAQSAIRLVELGPRMQLQLIKIQDDFGDGAVIFHEFVKKTPEEVAALQKRREERERLRQQRKADQERNVKRKRGESDEQQAARDKAQDDDDEIADYSYGNNAESEDDDAEYYKQEVGEDANPEDFMQAPAAKRQRFNPLYKKKSKKTDEYGGEEDDAMDDGGRRPKGKSPKGGKPGAGHKSPGHKDKPHKQRAQGKDQVLERFNKIKGGKR
eukprot:TRINITY_DN15061_c0_g1_i1.p1 TRINITY_DN15061_c0_g1~~TRINITY_DN15061_c0_g1_i1.p1  ORF type:complete len:482 (-),score=202.29 TRINITY_DN15061_c0_g1_i1:379-1824(-)